jgi:hypothetical protein
MMTTHSPHALAAAEMAEAASALLAGLSADLSAKASYPYMDGERMFWYYPPLNRHGVPLRDMDVAQRSLAMALMASGLNEASYKKATQIIDLETVLREVEADQGVNSFRRDPELYYFTVFGEPGGTDPWGWRAEGHHISLNYSIWGDEVISVTPFFFGSNPAEVRTGPRKGLRILSRREDLALELAASLDGGQRSKAVIYEEAPYDIVTYNSSRASLPFEEGLPASRMTGVQKELLTALVDDYVGQVRGDVHEGRMAGVIEHGIDRLHFAWGGPVNGSIPHYYRIHGGDFLVEFDNYQNGANHVHSVWRDVGNDFASDVLRDHLLAYHVL